MLMPTGTFVVGAAMYRLHGGLAHRHTVMAIAKNVMAMTKML